MKSKFDLSTVLQTAKTAASQSTKTASDSSSELQDADVSQVLDSFLPAGEKNASVSAGNAELSPDQVRQIVGEKVASLATTTESARLKEAQFLGAALFDGFITRANESELNAQKMAAVQNIEDPDLEKIAEELGRQHGVEMAMKAAEMEIYEGQKAAAIYTEQVKEALYEQGHMHALQTLAAFGEE